MTSPRRIASTRRSRPPRQGWIVIRVVLLAQGGEGLVDPPGRDLLVSDTNTFGDLASGIDHAFARWDLSHLHEFRLADGRRIGAIDPDGFEDDAVDLDERKVIVQQVGLRPGDALEYVFDLGDRWKHRCTLLRQGVDPVKEFGARPSEVVPIFGWGAIPDQYGRTTPDEEDA